MDFKNYAIVYALVLLVAVVFVATRIFPNITLTQLISPAVTVTPGPSTSVETAVTVIVNFGDVQKTYADITAPNAYLALVEAVRADDLEVTTKQYDFGLLVEKVGTYENSTDRAWIYFVNGTAGDVAADKKVLMVGDSVEWKYVKPE